MYLEDSVERVLKNCSLLGKSCWCFLSFLGRAVGFVAKHTWALTVFVAGFIGVWLMQKVKKIDISFFHYPRPS